MITSNHLPNQLLMLPFRFKARKLYLGGRKPEKAEDWRTKLPQTETVEDCALVKRNHS